jgi:NAD(P)-dependent dehydrogenase (short-subunit alcohol dehydrogenase family)
VHLRGDRLEPSQRAAHRVSAISLDGHVALVTGAGRGLGRAYALELAKRGAAIVVNDPGVNIRGDDAGERALADAVVAEITAAGGNAIADYGSVADPEATVAMVQRAVDAFGTLDIVVNNAGNNRRDTFADTTLEDLRNVIDVHLVGSFLITKAAWPILAAKRYGRIVFTTSQVGFYGKVDSVAYGMAKAGVVGLMHGVRLSAEPLGIKVNCIAPFALTRLGDIFPKDIAGYIDPAQVATAIVLLCSERCPVSGEIVIAGGGHFATARTLESRGIDIDIRPRSLRKRSRRVSPKFPACVTRCSFPTRSRRSARLSAASNRSRRRKVSRRDRPRGFRDFRPGPQTRRGGGFRRSQGRSRIGLPQEPRARSARPAELQRRRG